MFADEENFNQVRRTLLRSLPFQFISASLVRHLLLQKACTARIQSEKQVREMIVLSSCFLNVSANESDSARNTNDHLKAFHTRVPT